ncbi:MAG: hypothetical protein JRJ66_09035 [Deltaproteobacteria bacterium]|nr:hypothetical protein [Deltaproteobacteria bacterium]MBW2022346.1 hypothetical protein [Deltaproteobacteria bacterium]MBW2082668.1 hypothetical protein [Deltaproteobacteria bacterium]
MPFRYLSTVFFAGIPAGIGKSVFAIFQLVPAGVLHRVERKTLPVLTGSKMHGDTIQHKASMRISRKIS